MSRIYFLLDASSSMRGRKSKVLSSVNEFLDDQRSEENCIVSFYTFSRQVTTVFENKDIQSVTHLRDEEYEPNGTTALWDAMGFVLQKIPVPQNDLSSQNSSSKLILIIVTDGEENSSLKWTPLSLKNYMTRFGEKLEVVYIGSNQDAVLNGHTVQSKNDASLTYSDEKLPEALRSTSSAVKRYQRGQSDTVRFTPQERQTSI
jgi:uncharacterized protein YegL